MANPAACYHQRKRHGKRSPRLSAPTVGKAGSRYSGGEEQVAEAAADETKRDLPTAEQDVASEASPAATPKVGLDFV